MILSVLIPAISVRTSTLSRSLWYLQQQTGDFEILVHPGDDVGLGDKTNRLIQEAAGEYVVVVDDDDYLVPHYMRTVLPFLESGPDFVGYRILALWDGKFWLSIAHDAKNEFGSLTLDRGVCSKMPIRRSIASQVMLGNEFEADWPWAQRVHELVETSLFIDEHLYVYDWWPNAMGFPGGKWAPGTWAPQQDVGLWPVVEDRVRWLL